VVEGITDTSSWLDILQKDSPPVGTINSPADLARLSRKYQALKDRVDKKEDVFRVLNDKGNELLLLHQSRFTRMFRKQIVTETWDSILLYISHFRALQRRFAKSFRYSGACKNLYSAELSMDRDNWQRGSEL
jgi:hypothetical protein